MKNKEVLINDYFKALSNEIAIDIIRYDTIRIAPEEMGFLPRPVNIRTKISSLRLARSIAFLLKLFWLSGGALIFYFVEMIKLTRFFTITRISKEELSNCNTFLLAYSARAAQIIPTITSIQPDCIMTVPWEKVDVVGYKISFFSLLSLKDAFYVLLLAITSVYKFNLTTDREWILQTYTAFRWFSIRVAINKIKGEFFIAEHFDRWAVLTDCYIESLILESYEQSKLQLIQHGILKDIEMKGQKIILPYRLKNVSKLWVYDEYSKDYFISFILDTLGNNFDVKYFSSNIDLIEIDNNFKKSVMFIGHPACENFHINILSEMQKMGIYCIYKPHPKNASSKKVYMQDWFVVEQKDYFPKVDLLISYPSTLVQEYESQGIFAIVHSINAGEHEIKKYSGLVKEALS